MRRAVGRKAMERLGIGGRTGVQFRFDIQIHSMEFETTDSNWRPETFVVEWKRSARLVSTADRPWEKVKDGVYMVRYEQELKMLSTMYRKDKNAHFEKKEYKFNVEEVRHNRSNRLVATLIADLSQYADVLGTPKAATLSFKSVSKKVSNITMKVTIQSQFLRDDIKGDDALSLLSGISINAQDQRALDSDEEDDPMSRNGSREHLDMSDPASAVGLVISAPPSPMVGSKAATLAAACMSGGAASTESNDVLMSSSETDGLPAEILKLRGQYARDRASWAEERNALLAQMEALKRADASDVAEELRVTKVQSSAARARAEDDEKMIAELQHENEHLRERLDDTERELKSLRLVYENVHKENKKLRAQNKAVVGTLSTAKRRLSVGAELAPNATEGAAPSLAGSSGAAAVGSLTSVNESAEAAEFVSLLEDLINAKMELANMTFAIDEVRLEKKGVARQLAQEKLRCMEYARKLTDLDWELHTLRAKVGHQKPGKE